MTFLNFEYKWEAPSEDRTHYINNGERIAISLIYLSFPFFSLSTLLLPSPSSYSCSCLFFSFLFLFLLFLLLSSTLYLSPSPRPFYPPILLLYFPLPTPSFTNFSASWSSFISFFQFIFLFFSSCWGHQGLKHFKLFSRLYWLKIIVCNRTFSWIKFLCFSFNLW